MTAPIAGVEIKACGESCAGGVHKRGEPGAVRHFSRPLEGAAGELDDLSEEGIANGDPRNEDAELRA